MRSCFTINFIKRVLLLFAPGLALMGLSTSVVSLPTWCLGNPVHCLYTAGGGSPVGKWVQVSIGGMGGLGPIAYCASAQGFSVTLTTQFIKEAGLTPGTYTWSIVQCKTSACTTTQKLGSGSDTFTLSNAGGKWTANPASKGFPKPDPNYTPVTCPVNSKTLELKLR